ncbi:twin-arginine translocation signal domain-containing protein [Aminobacter anthyllidis]|uniref:Twin-arginine translocation signal domain-containing protein n=1 Tax=Aminobacter anthyllidis TaxID=1035067 RepID=A0A9X1A7Y1_9HYPH|nr:twin-arginine translocation signal domain-containing protein [Aminobacter anthyllidis]MBT1154790.1 twin-arginine translocation signal domain-containing protein [Aminobacter anthyllidis]MDH4984601.1 twin-arginine translocation signal domain-containing protein [Aminobacter anthyllidis]
MVTIYQGRPGLTRRELLKRGSAAGALLIISGSAVLSTSEAWGLESTALKPETIATLIQLARDIYPHDQVPDKYYAIAIKSHDEQAGKDAAHKELIEKGIADLDQKSGAGGYTGLGWEDERVAILRQIEDTPFFQAIRGSLVVGLYNQKEVWPIFGYEGESYSKGGYIARGFDDIEWL